MMRMRAQYGFSIFETLVALLITMIMLAGILKIFMNSRTVSLLETNFTDLEQNARFTSAYLADIIRLAGYRSPPASGLGFQNVSTVFPSANNYVAGTDGTGANGSDTLTIRYQGSGNSGAPDGTIRDCLNNPIDGSTIATNAFSLNASNQLVCNGQVIVSNVENMQVLFGENVAGNGTAGRYVPASFPSLNMQNVVSIRISLLFKSNDPVEINPVQKTYNLLGYLYTPTNFTYLRIPVTFTVTLRNLITTPR